jgi:predicted Na+-dependent transporter
MSDQHTLHSVANILVVLFVVSNMLALGMTLTMREIIAPLRDWSLVAKALVANFVLVPILAYLLVQVTHLERGLAIGLILVATAAGDAFLLKLSEVAKANMAFTLGLLVLLNVASIVCMPVVVPLLLPGITVDPMSIAKSLILLMLIPLAVGLTVRASFEKVAGRLSAPLDRMSSVLIAVAMTLILFLTYDQIIATWGSRAILCTLILVPASFAFGYCMVSAPPIRSALGLGTGQRNGTAALVIAVRNFPTDYSVVVMIAIFILIGSGAILMLLAVFCRRANVRLSAAAA